MKKELVKEKYVSNVIEIKPDKRYAFVIEIPHELTPEQCDRAQAYWEMKLKKHELYGSLSIILDGGIKSKILEIDKEKNEEKLKTVEPFKGIGDDRKRV